jgi:TolB-like protein/tetratricopeptide (TPR) repeat protein
MKECPKCQRAYLDATLNFCLEDGEPLRDYLHPADFPTEVAPFGIPPLGGQASAMRAFESDATQLFDLRSSSAQWPPKSGTPNSIAVLPFSHLSSDPDDEYFCDGLAEELINALAKIDGLKVVARTSAFSFKGKNVDVARIGSILNVQNIIEGSVRKFGERMRITVQLINASDGYHVWSEKYDTEMRDIFDVQDEITASVVGALKTKLLGKEDTGDDKMAALIAELQHHARDIEAYQQYLRGRFFLNKFTPRDFEHAIECFEKAIDIDHDYAAGYAGLADAHMLSTELGSVPPNIGMPMAKEAALKALSLDPMLSDAHSALGFVLQDFDFDFAGAESEFRRAIELNPNNSNARRSYAHLLAQLGRHDEAEPEFKKALEIDPLSAIGNWIYSFGLFEARRYDDCISQAEKTLQLDPNFPAAYLSLSFAYHMKQDYAASVEAYAKFSELCGSTSVASAARKAFSEHGWEGYLQVMIDRNVRPLLSSYIVAVYHAALHETDAAFESLEESYAKREPYIVMLNIDPRFDELRVDPRFKELIAKVGFPE